MLRLNYVCGLIFTICFITNGASLDRDEDTYEVRGSGRLREKRMANFDNHVNNRWNTVVDGVLTIKYQLDAAYSNNKANKIRSAISQWESETCIRFEEHSVSETLTDHHVLFVNGDECSSKVGMTTAIEQNTILKAGTCIGLLLGRVLHEISHIFGVQHQHQRPDRDDHITVNWTNIVTANQHSFSKKTTNQTNTYGVPYDISSLLHYAAKDYDIDSQYLTIIANDVNYQHNMGNLDSITFFDAQIVNEEYCHDVCVNSSLTCARGGYPDPNDCTTCKCIEGLEGNACQTVSPSDSACPSPVGAISVTSSDWTCQQLTGYKYDVTCNWLLQADSDKHVELKLNDTFDVHWGNDNLGNPCRHYLEVRYKGDLSTRGPRMCGENLPAGLPKPFDTGTVTSELHEMMLTFRSVRKRTVTYAGFQMCYRSVD